MNAAAREPVVLSRQWIDLSLSAPTRRCEVLCRARVRQDEVRPRVAVRLEAAVSLPRLPSFLASSPPRSLLQSGLNSCRSIRGLLAHERFIKQGPGSTRRASQNCKVEKRYW